MSVDLPLIAIASALVYELGRRRMGGRRWRQEGRTRAEAFYAGLFALLVATGPPLDGPADRLFWAHMVQHLLLQMVAPPLIVIGAPWIVFWRVLPRPSRRRLAGWLAHSTGAAPFRGAARIFGLPVVAWVAFIGTIAVAHLPAIFDFSLRNSVFHEAEHALFLGLGLLFWSRAIDSPPFHARLRPAGAIAFFLTAIIAESLLALVIMGVRSRLYAPYAALVPRPEGLSAIADQQLGGTMMLEPASLPLLIALLWSLKRWIDGRAVSGQTPLPARETMRA